MWAVVAALAALAAGSSAGVQPRCEEITIPMCRGIGYNMTSFPNALDHDTQDEAGLEVSLQHYLTTNRRNNCWLAG